MIYNFNMSTTTTTDEMAKMKEIIKDRIRELYTEPNIQKKMLSFSKTTDAEIWVCQLAIDTLLNGYKKTN